MITPERCRRTVATRLTWGVMVLAGLSGTAALQTAPLLAQTTTELSVTGLSVPAAPGAREPHLSALPDGGLAMSWTEPAETGFAIRLAIRDGAGWSAPRTIVQSRDLYVNWADFASVAAFGDGTLAAHWLTTNGPSAYDYDVNIALSPDAGQSWGDAFVPHRDGLQRQHGFVSLVPVGPDRMFAFWLDGRSYDIDATGVAESAFTNAAQLRVASFGSDGSLSEETLLDARTCTCCQTSAAVTGSGDILVVYRDRTADELRDISVIRFAGGKWSAPENIHDDGWEISGCPVNGPAVDAQGQQAVAAWFTAAGDIPAVKVAFSRDGGKSFGPAMRIDRGDPSGRVDAVQLADGSALISWLEWQDGDDRLLVCRVTPAAGCTAPLAVERVPGAGAANFPRMVRAGDDVFIAWTRWQGAGETGRRAGMSVALARLDFRRRGKCRSENHSEESKALSC